MDIPESACAVLRVRAVKNAGQWGIGFQSPGEEAVVLTGSVPTGEDCDRTRVAAVLAGFEALLQVSSGHPHTLLQPTPSQIRPALAEVLKAFPAMDMLQAGHLSAYSLAKRVDGALDVDLEALAQKTDRIPVDLVVNTDASVSNIGKTAGTGWVAAEPGGQTFLCGQRAVKVSGGDIHMAEIIAIEKGIRGAVQQGRMRGYEATVVLVECDSQAAIITIQRTLTGDALDHLPRALRTASLSAAGAVREHGAELAWVKGHQGHEANEQADRLAVLARRNAEMGLAEEQRQALVKRVYDDILQAA